MLQCRNPCHLRFPLPYQRLCPFPVIPRSCLRLGARYLQVESLFDSFAQSLEARFSNIDSKFSQVMSASASKVGDGIPVSDDVSQDVLTPSISAPSAVTRSFCAYTRQGSLGTAPGAILGWPAAVGSSLSILFFEDLMVTVRVIKLSGGCVPDSYLDCAAWSFSRQTILLR